MTKFNKKGNGTKTINVAGGKAYKKSTKLELVSNLLTSFVQDQFYRSESKGVDRLKEMIASEKDKLFIAKAAVFARNKFGMRSITHITAGELAHSVKGETWTKGFYEAVVHRPDDVTEILSYYLNNYNKPIPNSLKKGLGKALLKFDAYQIAKYKGGNKDLKMVDAINLLHPKHNEVLASLVKGTLKAPETWEVELTQAGQKANSEEEKEQFKRDVWVKLIKEKKIGYFALLRNLRNILTQAPELVEDACAMLIDERLIKNSLVLPFRYSTAIEQIKEQSAEGTRKVVIALSKALDISCKNVPVFDGKTLVVIDSSGSMSGKPSEIAGLFGAILYKSNESDLMLFSDEAKYINLNPTDSTLTIKGSIPYVSGGTNFHAIFQTACKRYDRIIILSDMQGWMMYDTPVKDYEQYCSKYKCKPLIYSWNLNDQDGTLQFPQDKVFCLAGWSEKVFDIMKLLKEDKNALLTEIEKTTW